MNWIFCGVAVILGLYLLFSAAPAAVAYGVIFSRKQTVPLDSRDLSDTSFAPFTEQISQGLARFDRLSFIPLSISAADNTPLRADFCPGDGKRLVIFFHGYSADSRNNFFAQVPDIHNFGCDILLVQQRAHNESGGKHTGMGLLEWKDVLRWVDWALEQSPKRKIILYGTSMGAVSVAYASENLDSHRVKAMVLDCGYASPYRLLSAQCQNHRIPPWLTMPNISLAAKLFLGADMKRHTGESLEKTDIPAFFLCGTVDETVGFGQFMEGYERCASKKELLTVKDAPHTLAYMVGGAEAKDRLLTFMENTFNTESEV